MDTFFQIADLIIKISLPANSNKAHMLPTFLPFEFEPIKSDIPDVYVDVKLEEYPYYDENAEVLTDVSTIVDYNFRLEETKTNYIVSIVETQFDSIFRMRSTKDFKHNTIYTTNECLDDFFRLKWMLMAAFGQFALSQKRLLIHASAVLNAGSGYAFLGVSGTGKSTHSKLWLRHIPGSELLNDDNPIIHIKDDGSVWIYGSPWSGKTNCYVNKAAPLKAIFRLEQYPENILTPVEGKSALFTLLPSGSALTWNDILFQLMVDHMTLIIKKVKVYNLKCLPDKAASELSFNAIN